MSEYVPAIPVDHPPVPTPEAYSVDIITYDMMRHRLAALILAQANLWAAEQMLVRAMNADAQPALVAEMWDHSNTLMDGVVSEFLDTNNGEKL